jgi:dihydroflavonol-4-reductase
MTVVVTGASGHLGANLVRTLLDRGEHVRVLVHRSAAALAEVEHRLERVEGSVTEPESLGPAFAGADRVYHLAGVISIDGDPDGRVHRVNVEGTRNVATACLAQGVGRLVHVSSVHAYAMDPRDEVLDETRHQVGDSSEHSAYDRSKALGERAVREAIEAGLDAVIVNPTGILGPVDYGPSRLGQLLGDLSSGRLPALLDGGFDFVDVRDVVDGTLAAGARGRAGENYILGNRWYSLRELADVVASHSRTRAPILVTPVWAARLGIPFARVAAKLTKTEPLFTRESLEVLVSNRSISSAKARTELGYAPRALSETVADTLAWLASQGSGSDSARGMRA